METLTPLILNIFNNKRSGYLKAVDLYEFQTAVFMPDAQLRRSARTLAALRFLEVLEKEKPQQIFSPRKHSLWKLDYDALVQEVMVAGWRGIRKLPSDKDFTRILLDRLDESKFAADVVDFLIHYQPDLYGRRASLSLAKKMIHRGYEERPGSKRYGNFGKMGDSTVKSRWRKFKDQAIFLCLLKNYISRLKPALITGPHFTDRLLEQTRNTARLKRFFRAYNFVAKDLSEKGVLEDLALEGFGAAPPKKFANRPPSKDLSSAVSKYKSVQT